MSKLFEIMCALDKRMKRAGQQKFPDPLVDYDCRNGETYLSRIIWCPKCDIPALRPGCMVMITRGTAEYGRWQDAKCHLCGKASTAMEWGESHGNNVPLLQAIRRMYRHIILGIWR